MNGIVALVLIGLVIYLLERNHRRQLAAGDRLAGGSPVEDTDLGRVDAELAAIADHRPLPARPARAVAHARFATAGRFHA